MTIEELLQSEDISKVVSELRNGRLSVEPNTKEHAAQYDPKLHDINDTQKRPDKLVVIDKDSDEYGEVKNVNPNVEQTTEQGFISYSKVDSKTRRSFHIRQPGYLWK